MESLSASESDREALKEMRIISPSVDETALFSGDARMSYQRCISWSCGGDSLHEEATNESLYEELIIDDTQREAAQVAKAKVGSRR